jgi:uncharacterized protein with PQ loop repeat
LSPETVLAVAASSFGIVMGASPLLQIRKMLGARSSREVSIGYFAILAFGSTLWGSYAVSIHNAAVFIPNVVAGITAVATITVAVSLRRVKEIAQVSSAL